jgi:hypothetical protein
MAREAFCTEELLSELEFGRLVRAVSKPATSDKTPRTTSDIA